MVVYKIVYTKDSIKDIEKIKGTNLDKKVLALIEIIKIIHFKHHHLMKN